MVRGRAPGYFRTPRCQPPLGEQRRPLHAALQLLEPLRDHLVRVVEDPVRLRIGHEHEIVGLIIDPLGAVLIVNSVQAIDEAADVACVHGEVEGLLDRHQDLARDRARRERTGQLLAAERRLGRPQQGRAAFGRPGLLQRVPFPVAVRIPEHAIARGLYYQAGVVAVVEHTDLGGVGNVLRRNHDGRTTREPKRRGDGKGEACVPLRGHGPIRSKSIERALILTARGAGHRYACLAPGRRRHDSSPARCQRVDPDHISQAASADRRGRR